MNAFHYHYVVGSQLEAFAASFTFSQLEIVMGQFHLFATEKRVELLVEQGQVEGIKAFVIILSILAERCFLPVYEVIVE